MQTGALFPGALQAFVHQAPRHQLGAGPSPPRQRLSMLLSIFLTPFSVQVSLQNVLCRRG